MSAIDVAIVGGGPVGATLALLAARAGARVEVFEARAAPSGDARTLALSQASRDRLEDAGAWPAGEATAILTIHVSQRGGPGRTMIDARDQGLPALGYTIGYAALEKALVEAMGAAKVPLHFGHACTGIELSPESARVRFASGREVDASLLVLADGGANASRIPGIAFSEKDYGQHAVVAAVRTDREHGYRAYERFTPTGPLALLPVRDRFALVWTAAPAEAQRLLGLGDREFLGELQERFGDRAGRFTEVAARSSFPLKLRTVNSTVGLRTVLVGNAAQALHPIAGQGLNLGLRDASQLAAAIGAAAAGDLGGQAMLSGYRDSRRRDTRGGVAFTDFLVSTFGERSWIPAWGRGLALGLLDIFPPARRLLAERMIHGSPTS